MTTAQPATGQARRRARRVFHLTAGFYLFAWAIHTADHVRRGVFDMPIGVLALGNVQVLLTLAFVGLLLKRHPLAPVAAIAIGVPATIGIAVAHLLPDFGPISDSLWADGIDGFTWFAVILEILGTVAVTAGGVMAWRAVDYRPPSLQPG